MGVSLLWRPLRGSHTSALILTTSCVILFLPSLYALLNLLRRAVAWQLCRRNDARRRILLTEMGIREHDTARRVVGFFHPYCNAGGGGERVLWVAIAYMQRTQPDVVCVVYTGDIDATADEIIAKAAARFSINLDPATLAFIFLHKRPLVEDTRWRHFTLLGQSLGSVVLMYEALSRLIPDVLIDTMGYAFAVALARSLTDIPLAAYVHYPTISSTMVHRVQSRSAGHTNQAGVAASTAQSYAKLVYYILFTEMYSLSLRQADYVMVNSTWTYGHVQRLLQPLSHRDDDMPPPAPDRKTVARGPQRAHIVYPPCDCEALARLPLETRECLILSIAQFRPEKDHAQQLYALRRFLDLPTTTKGGHDVKLIMAGSVRNQADRDRVQTLSELARALGLRPHVDFVLNAPYAELVELYGRASIGLSTMIDEHFGINIVEMMAAGLIPVVHASGGPLLDIVAPDAEGRRTGFHATSAADFATAFSEAFGMSAADQLDLRQRARQKATECFDTATFERGWQSALDALKRPR